MKQLASGKHMENDCFPRTLKFEMQECYEGCWVCAITFLTLQGPRAFFVVFQGCFSALLANLLISWIFAFQNGSRVVQYASTGGKKSWNGPFLVTQIQWYTILYIKESIVWKRKKLHFSINTALYWTSTAIPLWIWMLSPVLQRKKADVSRWGHEGRECKRNVQYSPFAIYG
jgi:hypothetical protein